MFRFAAHRPSRRSYTATRSQAVAHRHAELIDADIRADLAEIRALVEAATKSAPAVAPAAPRLITF